MVFEKSSKQLLSLTKALAHGADLHNKVADSLLLEHGAPPKQSNHRLKFSKHPKLLTSDSSASFLNSKNGYFSSSLLNGYSKLCEIAVTNSEHSVLNKNLEKHSRQRPRANWSPDYSCSSNSQQLDVPADVNASCNEIVQAAAQSTTDVQLHASSSEKKTAMKTKEQPAAANVEKKGRNQTDLQLRSYMQRITNSLEEIRNVMVTGIDPPDGAEDWDRARIRTVEFASRFGRNYLYRLGREINELYETTRNSGNPNIKTINHHLLTTHQSVLQALQAYRSHMCSILANALAERLQYIVEQILITCDIHMKYLYVGQMGSSRRENLINVLAKRCTTMLDLISEAIERRGQVENMTHCPDARLAMLGYKVAVKKPGKAKPRVKGALEARLSMYSVSNVRTKDVFWKKTVENLAKNKLRYNHVQSRYKTIGYKSKGPAENPVAAEVPSKTKLCSKRSSSLLRNTPLLTPQNEDEIVTMVEIQNKTDVADLAPDAAVVDCKSQADVIKDIQMQALAPLIQQLCQQLSHKDGEAVTQKQLELLLKGLLGMALDGKIDSGGGGTEAARNGEAVQVLPRTGGSTPGLSSAALPKQRNGEVVAATSKQSLHELDIPPKAREKSAEPEDEHDKTTDKKRSTVVEVSGTKNAQLICMVHEDDSTAQEQDVTKPASCDNANNHTKPSPDAKPAASNQHSESHSSPKKQNRTNSPSKSKGATELASPTKKGKGKNDLRTGKSSKTSIKISRLSKKSLRQLALLPKAQACSVIQYKLQYSKFSKGNPMYRKTSKVQPWIIIDKISDHLLNDLLLSIAREIQVDQVLEGLYRSEFQ